MNLGRDTISADSLNGITPLSTTAKTIRTISQWQEGKGLTIVDEYHASAIEAMAHIMSVKNMNGGNGSLLITRHNRKKTLEECIRSALLEAWISKRG